MYKILIPSGVVLSLIVGVPVAMSQTPSEKLLSALCSENWLGAIAAVDLISQSPSAPPASELSEYRQRLVRISQTPGVKVPIQDCVVGRVDSASVNSESVRSAARFNNSSTISGSAIDESKKPQLQRAVSGFRSGSGSSTVQSEAVNRARSAFGQ